MSSVDARRPKRGGFEGHCVVHGALDGAVQGGQRHPHGHRGVPRDARGHPAGALHELAVRHHPVGEPDLRRARAPSIISPVRINSAARPRPTSRARRTVPPVPGYDPEPDPREDRSGHARSRCAGGRPGPARSRLRARTPPTAAITGLGKRSILRSTSCPARLTSVPVSVPISASTSDVRPGHETPCPPAPVRMTARTSASSRRPPKALSISAITRGFSAFSFACRSIVTVATPAGDPGSDVPVLTHFVYVPVWFDFVPAGCRAGRAGARRYPGAEEAAPGHREASVASRRFASHESAGGAGFRRARGCPGGTPPRSRRDGSNPLTWRRTRCRLTFLWPCGHGRTGDVRTSNRHRRVRTPARDTG